MKNCSSNRKLIYMKKCKVVKIEINNSINILKLMLFKCKKA